MNKNKPDEYLINSLISGDEDGIQEIYSRLYPKIKNYILTNKGNVEDAKDIMQKALLIFSLKLRTKKFEISSSFEGYFFTICRNLWRKEKKYPVVTLGQEKDHIAKMQDVVTLAIEQEKWDLFQEKLNLLSENCKKVLKLYFDKIPYDKITKELNYASENVVRQRIFKCKKKLKEFIQSDSRYNEIKS